MGFKERLKEAREKRGLTQLQLAQMVGVTKSAIANYETGVSSAKEQVLINLMNALDCDANFLWQDEIKKTAPLYSLDEQKVMQKYRLLNQEGQERLKTSLDDFLLIDKYLVHTEDKDLPAETKAAHQEIYQKRLEDEAAKQQEIDDLVAKIKAGSKGKVRLIAKGGFNTVMDPVKTPEEVAELIRKYKAGELKEEE